MLNKIPHSLRGMLLLGLLAWGVYISPMSPITALVMCGGATGGLLYSLSLHAGLWTLGYLKGKDSSQSVANVTAAVTVHSMYAARVVWWLTGIAAVVLSLKAVL